MKDDVPPLGPVPKKRRQLEGALDVHIAMWLALDTLTPSERRRVGDEKARRKALVPDRPYGLLIGPEGVTPEQFGSVVEAMARATEIHHPGVASRLHTACRAITPNVMEHHNDLRAVIESLDREIGTVVAAPKSRTPDGSGVWKMLRHARHRGLATRVISPDGTDQGATTS